jgi:hypothetical protein
MVTCDRLGHHKVTGDLRQAVDFIVHQLRLHLKRMFAVRNPSDGCAFFLQLPIYVRYLPGVEVVPSAKIEQRA